MAAKKTAKKAVKSVGSTPEERETWRFCRHEKVRYIPKTMTRTKFNASKIGVLSFHKRNLGQEALLAETENFAERLNFYLLGLRFAARQGAQRHVQASVKDPNDSMHKLLKAVEENYMP